MAVQVYGTDTTSSTLATAYAGFAAALAPHIVSVGRVAILALLAEVASGAPVCLPPMRVASISTKIKNLIVQKFPPRGLLACIGYGEQSFDQVYMLARSGNWSKLPPVEELAHLVDANGRGLLETAARNQDLKVFEDMLQRGLYVHEDLLQGLEVASQSGLGDIIDAAWDKFDCIAASCGYKNPVLPQLASILCRAGESYFRNGELDRAREYFSKARLFLHRHRVQIPNYGDLFISKGEISVQGVRVQAIAMQYFNNPKNRYFYDLFRGMASTLGEKNDYVGLMLVARAIQESKKIDRCVPKELAAVKNRLLGVQAEGLSWILQTIAACRVEVPSPSWLSDKPLFDQRCLHLALDTGVYYFFPFSKVADAAQDSALPLIDRFIPLSEVLEFVTQRTTKPISEAGLNLARGGCDFIMSFHGDASKVCNLGNDDWLAYFSAQSTYRSMVSGINGKLQDQFDSFVGLDVANNPCPSSYFSK